MNELTINGFSALTEEEMMIDGGWVAGAICGAIIGCATSGFVSSVHMCFSGSNMTPSEVGHNILNAMVEGAVSGAIGGALLPAL